MADTLPSPPVSREPTPQPSFQTLGQGESTRRLDELLEQYLEVLDRYTLLQEQLSQSFAKGFMSLANAQRNSNLGPGRRYGQDGYDGRMKALKRVRMGENDRNVGSTERSITLQKAVSSQPPTITDIKPEIEIYSFTPEPSSDTSASKQTSLEKVKEQSVTSSLSPSPASTISQKKPKSDPAYRDPVTWFGILVPPSLREAKKIFSESVGIVPELLATGTLLENLESSIWAVRAELGIEHQYSRDEGMEIAVRGPESRARS